ncbi:MAG TPA: pyridoxal-phosphate dependent enzyme [Herbaspirillum sp.]|nr:pyridoxal-phosphate dependent enzyme [Herbaspirillum sp.]
MNNQTDVNFEQILEAALSIKGHAHNTPVLTNGAADALTQAQLYFKCENLQRTGSFKFRGALHALTNLKRRSLESVDVVTFSSGNHGHALAAAAKLLGCRATVVMPSDAPKFKIEATRAWGANVHLYDREQEDRERLAQHYVDQQGMTLIPPFDYADVIAGQGTAAVELFEEVGPLDVLFVPVGGGGLIGGIALATHHLSPSCRVIGVEPLGSNHAQISLRTGVRTRLDGPHTIADGARASQMGKLNFALMQRYVDDIETVDDDALRRQMRFLLEQMKIWVEPTGCLAAAAAMHQRSDLRGKRVGVLLSGGNIDFSAAVPMMHP